jgi:hypothetical protein
MSMPPGFAEGLDRVAIVAGECAAAIDCGRVENQVFAALKRIDPLPFEVEPPAVTRSKLMEAGQLAYEDARAAEFAELLGVDALLVVSVPAAEQEMAPGWGGIASPVSRVRAEVFLRAADSRIAARGGGGGQAGTLVDRAVAEMIERIFDRRTTGEKLRAEAKRKAEAGVPGTPSATRPRAQ